MDRKAKTKKHRKSHKLWEIDLHGHSVDEAIEQVERFLDQAMLKGTPEVCLIHGHGSNKLKEAIRGHLSVSPYVAMSRPGSFVEGGDGVTVVTIREE